MRFAREAWPWVLPFVGLAIVLWVVGPAWSAVLSLVTGVAVLLFFRDPTINDDELVAMEHTDAMGVALVAVNSSCFVVVVVGTIVVIRKQQQNHAKGQMRIQYRGRAGGDTQDGRASRFSRFNTSSAEKWRKEELVFICKRI